jgi:hypothetical protein
MEARTKIEWAADTLREALRYRNPRFPEHQTYKDCTILITCADQDDVADCLEAAKTMTKIKIWRLQFLVDGQPIAEIKGPRWREARDQKGS